MKKVRIKRGRKKKLFSPPSLLPGMRGSAQWHMGDSSEHGGRAMTLNVFGSDAKMVIPQENSTEDKFIRLHEQLHAAHSPVEPPRDVALSTGKFIRKDAIIFVEEYRINTIGRYLFGGPENMPDHSEFTEQRFMDLIKGYMASKSPALIIEILQWFMVTWPLDLRDMTLRSTVSDLLNEVYSETSTPDDRALLIDLTELINEFTLMFREAVHSERGALMTDGTIPSWDHVLDVSEKVTQFFEALESTRKTEADFNPSGSSENQKAVDEDPDIKYARHFTGYRRSSSDLTSKPVGRRALETLRRMKVIRGSVHEEEPKWGKMDTRKVPLTKKLPKNKLDRSKYKAAEEGAVPRYPHRLLTDGKVFSRKKRTQGGSLLIDDSGSMRWGTQDIQDIVEAAPAVSIAAYSGTYQVGELVILADKGRWAEINNTTRPTGANNLVDYPALLWLASQSKPRIWVSDTQVTTLNDVYEKAFEQCIDLCKEFDINIVPNAAAAADVFNGKREIYR